MFTVKCPECKREYIVKGQREKEKGPWYCMACDKVFGGRKHYWRVREEYNGQTKIYPVRTITEAGMLYMLIGAKRAADPKRRSFYVTVEVLAKEGEPEEWRCLGKTVADYFRA